MAAVISVEQLAGLRRKAKILCASMGPNAPKEGIPGSFLADLEDDFSDTSHPLPHTVPDEPARVFEKYGISNDTPVVVYDCQHGAIAPRIWWLAHVAGLQNVAVLDGGVHAWVESGRSLEAFSDPEDTKPGSITAEPEWERLADARDVQQGLFQGAAKLIDVRSAPRFYGTEGEPRPGLRSGHMPGALNIPYTEFLNESGYFRDFDEVQRLFDEQLGSYRGPLIFSCGSGVTACVGALAANLVGYGDVQVYEGSWSEWGLEQNPEDEFPVVR